MPLTTLIPFHQAILATEQWANGETCRDLTEDKKWLKSLAPEAPPKPEVDGRLHAVKVIGAAAPAAGVAAPAAARRPPKRASSNGASGGPGGGPVVSSPLQGSVLRVAVEEGAEVEEGALICVIEAMKMENEITAHKAGKVTELNVSEGAAINAGEQICKIEQG